MTTIQKRWHSIDGWRGYYEPVPPEGWELLTDCSVVNESGEQARDIIAKWLRGKKIHYRSGYMQGSNVFSANLYIIVEEGKIDAELRAKIDDWFVDTATSTFSIMTGRSWDLDLDEAQRTFDELAEQ